MGPQPLRLASETMTPARFRAFQAERPNHERWELVEGLPVMMTPPTIAHNRIAGNLERLLNDALSNHDPSRIAVQRTGVELAVDAEGFRPEPDVAVIDADYEPGQRFADRVYLLAEIVSRTDGLPVTGSGEAWIELKRRLYRDHGFAEAVLTIEQDTADVRVDRRRAEGWTSDRLTALSARLVLPSFGLDCSLADLYRGTPIARRP